VPANAKRVIHLKAPRCFSIAAEVLFLVAEISCRTLVLHRRLPARPPRAALGTRWSLRQWLTAQRKFRTLPRSASSSFVGERMSKVVRQIDQTQEPPIR
jgi:hypothetical protein